MKKIKYIALAMVLSLGLVSCKKEYKINKASTVDMSGEWWVQIYADDDTTLYYSYDDIAGAFITSNTAADVNTELLLNLPAAAFGPFAFKAKVPIDYSNTSFKMSENLLNLNDSTASITIHEGKIWKNAATAPSLHKTDSIRLVIEYTEADPGTKYVLKGYKNTGWPEDRHD